jgi:hypothetical protein
MSGLRTPASGSVKAAVCLALLLGVSTACGEDGKTAPDKCNDPPLPIYDIQQAGEPSVDNPCVTKPGYAISGTTTSAGGASSGP